MLPFELRPMKALPSPQQASAQPRKDLEPSLLRVFQRLLHLARQSYQSSHDGPQSWDGPLQTRRIYPSYKARPHQRSRGAAHGFRVLAPSFLPPKRHRNLQYQWSQALRRRQRVDPILSILSMLVPSKHLWQACNRSLLRTSSRMYLYRPRERTPASSQTLPDGFPQRVHRCQALARSNSTEACVPGG